MFKCKFLNWPVIVFLCTTLFVSCGGKKPTILEGTWINDIQPEWNEISSEYSDGIGGIVFGGNKMAVFYPYFVKGLGLETLELMRMEFSLNGNRAKLWLKEIRLSRDAVYMTSMSDIIAEAKEYGGGNVRKLQEYQLGEFTFEVSGDKFTIINSSGCGESLVGTYTKLK
jgi:hypothetical protein